MTIPTYDKLMLPVLRLCAQKTWIISDLVAQIADDLQLNDIERNSLIPSGSATVITSRVQWAKTYLKQAGLVEQPKRGYVEITERGRKLLRDAIEAIDVETLKQFEEFQAFLSRTKSKDTEPPRSDRANGPFISVQVEPTATPEERIDSASLILTEALRDALLARVLESTPAFFEKLIVDLLLAMGYGGTASDAGEHLGGTGDGGVDGVIREDQLGLDRIYLQAKRYQPGNTVSSEAIHAFMGALISKGSHKGVFITTSTFSKPALQVATQPSQLRLVLIDGEELTRLMVRFGIGVRVARTVQIKRIDLDYFAAADPE